MKGLRLLSTTSLMLAISSNLSADLKQLNDHTLSKMTGQSGITIDLEARVSIGEIAYKDGGYLTLENLQLSGVGGSALDNMRITVDVANQDEVLTHGFSKYSYFADAGLLSTSDADTAWAIGEYGQGSGEYGKTYNDGDLVLHLESRDKGMSSTASATDNLQSANQAIDFKLKLDSLNLADSNYDVGTYSSAAKTTLLSNISMEGYLGPADIVIRNNGDAKTNTLPNGVSVGDSTIEIDANFRVTDLDFTWDVADVLILFNLAGVQLNDMKIHNTRGADTLGHFGFASVEATIASASGIQNTQMGQATVDGIAIYDVDLRMDLDMSHISFGSSGTSIGQVYFTDFVFSNTSLIVSAH